MKEDDKRTRRDDEARMARASHSHRVIQVVAQISRPSRFGNLDRSRQQLGAEMLDDYFVYNSAFPDTYFRRRFRMERHLFNRIMTDVCNYDSYFLQKKDAFGAMGFLPEQKITATLRMLAYGASEDQVDEITRIGKSTILESLMRFCGAVESIHTAEHLQKPINMDLQRLLKKGNDARFSWDDRKHRLYALDVDMACLFGGFGGGLKMISKSSLPNPQCSTMSCKERHQKSRTLSTNVCTTGHTT